MSYPSGQIENGAFIEADEIMLEVDEHLCACEYMFSELKSNKITPAEAASIIEKTKDSMMAGLFEAIHEK